jgi:ubiquinone/menaquinone biosynthesis C-methylase UbiE
MERREQQISSARAAQQQFGQQAELYARSSAHVAGEGLDAIVQYASMGSYDLAVDIGTGAGFTACAIAPFARHTLATDIAPQMLSQARGLARQRGLDSVGLVAVEAESLPFAAGSVDAVTCRQAAHHFHDLRGAVAEIWRVLKPGGVFIFTDPTSPESDEDDLWMNDVEVRRDLTHVRDLKAAEWHELLVGTGFQVTHASVTKVYLEFNDWVTRAATLEENIELLRRDFLAAPPSVVASFGIRPEGEDIHFHWDVLVARGVKS